MRIVLIVLIMLLTFGLGGASAAETPVGFTYVTVSGDTASRGDPSGRLTAVLWYPAASSAATAPIELGPPSAPYFSEGAAAKDAPFASEPARMPFIVVSHGTGGTAFDLAWLCAGLASRGYIVAAVNHPGNNALGPQTVAGNALWWLRAADLSRVIDGVLAMPRFGPRIDPARIGAAGISLGGYTVLAIAGARADPQLFDAYCDRKPDTPVCSGAATPLIPDLKAQSKALALSDPTYRAAVAENRDLHRDTRVKAVFAFEPAQGPAIVPESLAAIDIPVALVDGLGDAILPLMDNVIPDALALPNAQLTLFPKPVGHYTFLIDCAPAGRRKYATVCGDAGPERTRVHRDALELAASFFARTIGVAP